jgi:signal transduction histidine kinase
LIKDLLDLSQIESGDFPLRLADFDINKLLRQVLVRYADRGEAKGLEMEVDFRQESCFCRADVDRIEQVLNNLVDNAVKYTPENGRIAIWTHDTGQRTLVSISNTGPGIPSEDLPYVFERFYKTDKSHTDKTGTGLGLAIARKIVTQHGGNLSVRSTPGKETCFLMGLPSGYREPQREPPVDAEYVPANNSTDTSQTKE